MRAIQIKIRRASEIYALQNRIIHAIMADAGMPYTQYREDWMEAVRMAGGKKAKGLSGLTLGHRRKLIFAISPMKGKRGFNPAVPPELSGWRKGDPDMISGSFRRPGGKFPGRPADRFFDDPYVGKMMRKIEAMLAEAKRPWKYAHDMAKHMYNIDRLEWCHEMQIHDIVAALVYDAKRHGRWLGK
ncbi:MAG: hypothetical protein APR55_08150 [Methanolinea sp. SDB]|nr:MAG: hypothetical protein APR55_08150 [Methanolinea sp. SDB]